jgi:hypothetical protein
MCIYSLLLVVLLSLLHRYSSQCQHFASGQCPGSADCMCTMGVGCAVESNVTGFEDPKLRLGGCGGHCRQVAHGQCGGMCSRRAPCCSLPGPSSCLKNVGACGGGGGGCLNPCGSPCACCGKSPNGHYFLTSFDGMLPAAARVTPRLVVFVWCLSQVWRLLLSGSSALGLWHCALCVSMYVTRYSTYSVLAGKCVKLRVTDYGPSCFVENDAGGPVLDASPAVCRVCSRLLCPSFVLIVRL